MSDMYKKSSDFSNKEPGMVDLTPGGIEPKKEPTVRGRKTRNQPNQKNQHFQLTRRQLIYGAAGAGVLAAAGFGVKKATDTMSGNSSATDVLNVDKKNVADTSTFTELANNSLLTEIASVTLPYNTLVFANNTENIACLVPNDTATTLATVTIINKNTRKQITALDQAVNQKRGYDIYDVRANSNSIIWTELNILQGDWKIYGSAYNGSKVTNHVLLDEGGSEFYMPSLAASESNLFWQVVPKTDGDMKSVASFIRSVKSNKLTSNDNQMTSKIDKNTEIAKLDNVIWTAAKGFVTQLYSCNDGIVACQKPDTGSNYQIIKISDAGKAEDTLALPTSVIPLEATYGKNGFAFSLNAIYSNNTGISGLGTYCPLSSVSGNKYNDVEWMNFNKTPSAAPCWCAKYFVVRSSMAVCTFDLTNKSYSVTDRPNASDDFGEYLASQGECDQIVTFSSIYDQPVSGNDVKQTILRIFKAKS